MNKRAVSTTFEKLMGIVVVLVVIFILLYFIAKPYTATLIQKTDNPVENCRQTIALMSAEKQGIWRLFSNAEIPFDCQTHWYGQINITETTYEKQTKQAAEQIAPLLSECWYEFGEGKKDPFAKIRFFDQGYHCFLCSKFDMDYGNTKEPSDIFIQIDQDYIANYLQNNIEQKTKMPYSEYLNGAFLSDKVLVWEIEDHPITKTFTPIIPENGIFGGSATVPTSYAIVLFSWGQSTPAEMIGAEPGYKMFIMPYENFVKLPCKRLEKEQASLNE